MKLAKDIAGAVGALIIAVAVVFIILALSAVVGYFFGVLLAVTPFVNGLLVAGFDITTQQIPTITAWLAVAGLFIGGTTKVSDRHGKGD